MFADDADRLRFVFRALELYGRFFRPGTDGDEQMIRQRVNLAESSFPRHMSDLAAHFLSSGKHDSIWYEVDALRKRWPKLFPSLCGVFNVFYWDESRNTLDDYTLVLKQAYILRAMAHAGNFSEFRA
jgi:hypothetical protein